jgi:hypothetical protein
MAATMLAAGLARAPAVIRKTGYRPKTILAPTAENGFTHTVLSERIFHRDKTPELLHSRVMVSAKVG